MIDETNIRINTGDNTLQIMDDFNCFCVNLPGPCKHEHHLLILLY
jgi:hypothetical protein